MKQINRLKFKSTSLAMKTSKVFQNCKQYYKLKDKYIYREREEPTTQRDKSVTWKMSRRKF